MNVIARPARQLGRWAGLAPVVVRVIVGFLMFAHGVDKVSRGTSGISGFGEFLSSQGLPVGIFLAWFVALLELVGGAFLILGLLSRPIAALMTLELLGAIVLVTADHGLLTGDLGAGYERDLAYIMGFLSVVLLGPGRPSLDHLIGFEEAKPALIPTRE
ncbi:MAG: DoxX family protein [Acidimicrobiales bacterium]